MEGKKFMRRSKTGGVRKPSTAKTSLDGGGRVKYVGKPLASRDGSALLPTVFVDLSVKRCGPRLPREKHVPDPTYPQYDNRIKLPKGVEPFVFNPDQAALAATQWSSDGQPPDGKPWLSSWWYPTDAFDPWPDKATDLRCWHCTFTFTWSPFPLPRSYDVDTGRYRVIGVFCGPSCAKAYAIHSGKYMHPHDICMWIDQIARDHFGYYIVEGGPIKGIPVAPQRELLREYCGPKGFSIEQFRSVCAHGRSIRLLNPLYITTKQVIQAEMEVAIAHHRNNMGNRAAIHVDDPDDQRPVTELVKTKKPVFGGKGARPMNEFFRTLKK